MNLYKKEKSSSKIITGTMEEKDNTSRNDNIKKEQSDCVIRAMIGH